MLVTNLPADKGSLFFSCDVDTVYAELKGLGLKSQVIAHQALFIFFASQLLIQTKLSRELYSPLFPIAVNLSKSIKKRQV